mgnify:CR=1 FL=1|tara:strand:+ start:8516 stop:8731 length:216 start_codon:yes stop_codon:yes gene_type:complete
MKKLLLITMLALSLQANQCWHLELKYWINFNELTNEKTPLLSGYDEDFRPLHAYTIPNNKLACFYLYSDFR